MSLAVRQLKAFFVAASVAVCFVLSLPLAAQEKADPFADLFGAPVPSQNLNALKKATESIQADKNKAGLAVKQTSAADLVQIDFAAVQIARLMRKHPQKGCEVWGHDKMPLTTVMVQRLPAKSPPFFTCITGMAKRATQTQIRLEILGPRKRRLGQATVVLSFDGKTAQKALMEWPALDLSRVGQYTLAYEIAGKTIAKEPLFVVVEASPDEDD